MKSNTEKVLPRVAYASSITISQILGVCVIVMTAVWFSKYHGGFAWNDSTKLFGYHPLFMIIGLVFLNAEGMISYRVFRNESLMFVKIIYKCLQVAAFIFGIMGLSAVLKYSDQQKLKSFHTLHSWIGIVLVTLFGFQVLSGIIVHLLPGISESSKQAFNHFHKFTGLSIFVASTFQCCIGITEKSAFSIKQELGEERMLANFLGVVLILFCLSILAILIPEKFRRLTDKERAIIMLERYESD